MICKHCNGDISIRNPKGFCDHLYYPDSCSICDTRPSAPNKDITSCDHALFHANCESCKAEQFSLETIKIGSRVVLKDLILYQSSNPFDNIFFFVVAIYPDCVFIRDEDKHRVFQTKIDLLELVITRKNI